MHVLVAFAKQQEQGANEQHDGKHIVNGKGLVQEYQREDEAKVWGARKYELGTTCPHRARSADVKRDADAVTEGSDQ